MFVQKVLVTTYMGLYVHNLGQIAFYKKEVCKATSVHFF